MITRIWKRLAWEVAQVPVLRKARDRRTVAAWLESGKEGATPHCVKQANLRHLSRSFQIPTFIETGTFHGDMLCALHGEFARLISIELSEHLCDYSRKRCAIFENVEIYLGDSATRLADLGEHLAGRVLFWLDGHYSGGDTALGDSVSPIIRELDVIRSWHQVQPFILIDDARLFRPGTGYPCLREVFDHIREWKHIHLSVSIHDDAIVCIPSSLLVLADKLSEGEPSDGDSC